MPSAIRFGTEWLGKWRAMCNNRQALRGSSEANRIEALRSSAPGLAGFGMKLSASAGSDGAILMDWAQRS